MRGHSSCHQKPVERKHGACLVNDVILGIYDEGSWIGSIFIQIIYYIRPPHTVRAPRNERTVVYLIYRKQDVCDTHNTHTDTLFRRTVLQEK